MYHREQLLNKRCFIALMLAQNTIMACVIQRKKSVIASSSCLCAPLSSSVILCTDVFVCVRSNCVYAWVCAPVLQGMLQKLSQQAVAQHENKRGR